MPVVVTPYRNRSSADASRCSTSSHAVVSFMGITSDRFARLTEFFIPLHSLNTKIITAGTRVAHVDAVNFGRRPADIARRLHRLPYGISRPITDCDHSIFVHSSSPLSV